MTDYKHIRHTPITPIPLRVWIGAALIVVVIVTGSSWGTLVDAIGEPKKECPAPHGKRVLV